jgi:steroid delta-isomerase-like uncharacterized protein
LEEGRIDDIRAVVADGSVGHGAGAGGGGDALVADLRTWLHAFPDCRYDIRRTVTEGDTVAVHMTLRATHQGDFAAVPASGRPIEVAGTDLWRIEDGRIAEGWTLCDIGTLFMQIGALPVPTTAAAVAPSPAEGRAH